MMLVSIVVPVYNAEAYIERCALSLLRQSYEELEIIFVDDCSTDAGPELLRKTIARFPERNVKIMRNEQNQGSALTRQSGLDACTGEYVLQVDSDDYVAADYVSKLVACVQENGCDMAVCDFCYDYGTLQQHRHENPSLEPQEFLKQIIEGTVHASLANKLTRRSLFTDNDIRFTGGLNMFDDKSVVFRVVSNLKRVGYVPEALYYYNKTNAGSITSRNRVKAIEPALSLLQMMEKYYAGHELAAVVTPSINNFKANVMRLIVTCHNRTEAASLLERLGTVPTNAIISNPNIKWVYKVVLICYKAKLYPLVWIAKKMITRYV